MPFDSNGRFSLASGYLAVTGQTILASQHNPPLEDIASGLSVTLLRTGVAPMVANLPMGGYKVTGLGTGVAASDAATVGQTSALAVAAITGAALKATPVDADSLPLVDSAAGNTLKRLTWAALRAFFQPVSTVLTALSGIGTAVSGDIIYADGAGTWARRAKGSDGQFLQLASGLPTWVAGPTFTKSFESAQQTITSGGSVALAHGLGTQPKLYQIYLVAQASVLGYTSGNEVLVNPSFSASDPSGRGASVVPDATNINIRYGSDGNSFTILRKDNGDATTITNANWKLIARAWA